MSFKQLFILFLILFFVPALLGKVSLAPFSNFFQNISLPNFMAAFGQVFQDDFNYYKGILTPLFQQLIDLIKSNLPKTNIPNVP